VTAALTRACAQAIVVPAAIANRSNASAISLGVR
jgi:hypothetical protein